MLYSRRGALTSSSVTAHFVFTTVVRRAAYRDQQAAVNYASKTLSSALARATCPNIVCMRFGPNTTNPSARRSGSSMPKPMSHSGQLLSSTTLVLVGDRLLLIRHG